MNQHNLALLAQLYGRNTGIRDMNNAETSKVIIKLLKELQFGHLLHQIKDNFIQTRITPVAKTLVEMYTHGKRKIINSDETLKSVFKSLQREQQYCVVENEWSKALQVLLTIGHALFCKSIEDCRRKSDSNNESSSEEENERNENSKKRRVAQSMEGVHTERFNETSKSQKWRKNNRSDESGNNTDDESCQEEESSERYGYDY